MIIHKGVRLKLGILAATAGTGSRLMDQILRAAEGMPRAFTAIGYLLDTVPRYRSFASKGDRVYWYRIGARLGDYMAQYNLGQCYETGDGVKRDMRKAVACWQKAAAAGYPPAFTNLAAAYYNGEGVKRNITNSLALYGQASVAGDKIATKMLKTLDWSGAASSTT
jgi:TPR repeat protein